MKRFNKFGKSAVVAVALFSVLAATQALAHGKSEADSGIAYRQGAFHILGTHFGAMGAVIKGKADYDAATFQSHAEAVANVAALVANNGFQSGSEKGDEMKTDAKKKIWSQPEDFTEKATNFLTATAALAEVAKGGDLEAIKPAFGDAAKTCKACHKEYRKKD